MFDNIKDIKRDRISMRDVLNVLESLIVAVKASDEFKDFKFEVNKEFEPVMFAELAWTHEPTNWFDIKLDMKYHINQPKEDKK